jgi:hypothetical protein
MRAATCWVPAMGDRDFALALLDARAPIPAGLVTDGIERRFAVYRNNVMVSLTRALADIFPVVETLVGKPYFAAMARIFIAAEPPRSPLLFEYGRTFPDFLERFEPARHLSYLADVARLERAWLDAYHAADAPVLHPAALAAIAPHQLAETRLVAHPATRVLVADYAAYSIVMRTRDKQPLTGIDPTEHEDSLTTRPDQEVEIRRLAAGDATFLTALMAGEPLGTAMARAVAGAPEFDIGAALALSLQAGAFTAIAPSKT